MPRIIPADRSVVVALDNANLERTINVVRETCQISGIGGYKIGSALAANNGLPAVASCMRSVMSASGAGMKALVYDHQKFGSDIPDTGAELLAIVQKAKVDAIIVFPLAGPATQKSNIEAAKAMGLKVIAGGEMTHPNYTYKEGGYVHEQMLPEMYSLSASLGVRDFVVPGNKPDRVAFYKKLLESLSTGTITLWSPGFVQQGGEISEAARNAGNSFHAIVGRAITEAPDVHAAALELTSQLKGSIRLVE